VASSPPSSAKYSGPVGGNVAALLQEDAPAVRAAGLEEGRFKKKWSAAAAAELHHRRRRLVSLCCACVRWRFLEMGLWSLNRFVSG
jgi:hypothetical protein